MRKSYILFLICISMLLVPAFLSIFFPHLGGDSNLELRKLKDFPSFPKSIREAYNWPRHFNQFATDRFPFRTFIVSMVSKSLIPFGFSVSDEVLIGRDQWLFLRKNSDILNEYRGVVTLSDFEVKTWVNNFVKRKMQIEAKGSKVYFIIIPNKHSVYPNKLPRYISIVGETIAGKIIKALNHKNVSGVIDLRATLREKGGQEKLFGKFNTHWNDKGAYIGYRQIIQSMDVEDRSLVNEVEMNSSDFIYRNENGDLSRLIGNPDLVEAVPKALIKDKIISRGEKENYQKKEWVVENSNKQFATAVIFCDSFTHVYLHKFLDQTFSISVYKHHNSLEKFSEEQNLIKKYNPDFVFYIVVERLIPHKLITIG